MKSVLAGLTEEVHRVLLSCPWFHLTRKIDSKMLVFPILIMFHASLVPQIDAFEAHMDEIKRLKNSSNAGFKMAVDLTTW